MMMEGSQSCQSDLYQTAQEEEDMEDEEDQGRSGLFENTGPIKALPSVSHVPVKYCRVGTGRGSNVAENTDSVNSDTQHWYCAAKAFYSCPAIISQRLESRIISKEPQENTEEESKII